VARAVSTSEGMKGQALKILLVLSGCAASVLAAPPARANFLDGNDLYEQCQTRSASALNYILGVHDAQQALAGLGKQEKLVCPWGRVSSGHVIGVVCKYLQKNPSQRQLSGASIVLKALGEAFPCKPSVLSAPASP
jgi:Ssp1 endopeptidase immunity protein Rap1a